MTDLHDRHLLYFVRVADAGGVSAAARSLGISQPALSAALRRLQRDTGIALFRSHGRGLGLTPEGAALLVHARSAVRAMEDFSAHVRRLSAGDDGVVTVAAPSGVSISVLAPMMRSFADRHPRDHVRVHKTFALKQTVAAVREGKVDVALVPRLAVPRDLAGFEVGTYELVLAIAPGVAIPDGPVKLSALDQLLFISSHPGTAADRLLTAARSAGADPRVVLEEPEIGSLPPLVAEGVGSAVVVASMRRQLTAIGVAVRVFEERQRWLVRVVYRKGSLSPAATRFLDAVRPAAVQNWQPDREGC